MLLGERQSHLGAVVEVRLARFPDRQRAETIAVHDQKRVGAEVLDDVDAPGALSFAGCADRDVLRANAQVSGISGACERAAAPAFDDGSGPPSAVQGTTFIFGLPMNWATNRF